MESQMKFKKKKWKQKKLLSDREALHNQLTRTLNARLVQLSSSQGACTRRLDELMYADIENNLQRLEQNIETLSYIRHKRKRDETNVHNFSEVSGSRSGEYKHNLSVESDHDLQTSNMHSVIEMVAKQQNEGRTRTEDDNTISVIERNTHPPMVEYNSSVNNSQRIERTSNELDPDSKFVNHLLRNAHHKHASPSRGRLESGKTRENEKTTTNSQINKLESLNDNSSRRLQKTSVPPFPSHKMTVELAKQKFFKYIPNTDQNSTLDVHKPATEQSTSLNEQDVEISQENVEEEKYRKVLKSIKYPRVPNKLITLAELRKLQETDVYKYSEEDEGSMHLYDAEISGSMFHELDHSGSIEGSITDKAMSELEKQIGGQQSVGMEEKLVRRIKVFNGELRAYIDACVNTGMIKKAREHLNYYRELIAKNKTPNRITDVTIYNTLLRGLVREGRDMAELREVFSYITEDGLQPTFESYSLCLAGVGHKSDYDLMIATFIIKDMKKKGFDINDIFNQCAFLNTERHDVSRVLTKVIPNFKANPPKDTGRYEGPLVEPLNKPLPLIEVSELNPFAGVISKDDVLRKAEVQFGRELDGHVAIESIFNPGSDDKMHQARATLRERWKLNMHSAFKKRKFELKKDSYGTPGIGVYPFLCLFPSVDYVNIMVKEAEHLAMVSNCYSLSLLMLQEEVGQAVQARYMVQQIIAANIFPKLQKVYTAYIDQMLDPNLPLHNQRICWQRLTQHLRNESIMELPKKKWPALIARKVGEELYRIILENADIDANLFKREKAEKYVKCFYLVHRSEKAELRFQIKPHPMVNKLMNAQASMIFPTSKLPSLIPPVPFTSPTYGGNFIDTVEMLRFHADAQEDLLTKNQEAALPVFDALNVLSACAWSINKPVLDVILKVFKEGGNPDLSISLLPSLLDKPSKPKDKQASKEEMDMYYKQQQQYNKKLVEATSLWWSDLYRLSIANKFRDEVLWFPWNMDFRSRTYPCPPHLNHQGNDSTRGMMQFAKGKALGEEGLDWLKIHLVNLTGLHKRSSNTERLAFADKVLPDILDSADNPLTGNKWWMISDNPWQTLASCMEVAAAVGSDDPTKFVSHIPVHQDGSCNGLQHYAALGRDEAGAKSVNLYPFDKPSDVYSDVVDMVKKEIQHDIAEKNEYEHIARIADQYIERKVIKQSIMTTVYGVTAYGARQQIKKQLVDKKLPPEHMQKVSVYLTEKTFKSLKQMFSSAKQIQSWFDICANSISSTHLPVEWLTPLNFPAIQPYFKATKNNLLEPDKLKQRNGFSPNFIHSLDSTHMMLTALCCHRKGITFSSVHDCFWTHAANVDVMNKITREQFLALHSQPILEDLSQYFIQRFIDNDHDLKQAQVEKLRISFKAIPDKGTFDLNNVMKSTYFFS